jgi:hypothetical protein
MRAGRTANCKGLPSRLSEIQWTVSRPDILRSTSLSVQDLTRILPSWLQEYTRDLYWCCHEAARRSPTLEPVLVQALVLCLQENSTVAASSRVVENCFQVLGTAFSPQVDTHNAFRKRSPRLDAKASVLGTQQEATSAPLHSIPPVKHFVFQSESGTKEQSRIAPVTASRWPSAIWKTTLMPLRRKDLEAGCVCAALPSFKGVVAGSVAEFDWRGEGERAAATEALRLILGGCSEAQPIVMRGKTWEAFFGVLPLCSLSGGDNSGWLPSTLFMNLLQLSSVLICSAPAMATKWVQCSQMSTTDEQFSISTLGTLFGSSSSFLLEMYTTVINSSGENSPKSNLSEVKATINRMLLKLLRCMFEAMFDQKSEARLQIKKFGPYNYQFCMTHMSPRVEFLFTMFCNSGHPTSYVNRLGNVVVSTSWRPHSSTF